MKLCTNIRQYTNSGTSICEWDVAACATAEGREHGGESMNGNHSNTLTQWHHCASLYAAHLPIHEHQLAVQADCTVGVAWCWMRSGMADAESKERNRQEARSS